MRWGGIERERMSHTSLESKSVPIVQANVPCATILLVELFLDIARNILLQKKEREMKVRNGLLFGTEPKLVQQRTFSILNSDKAFEATSTASCCMLSDMSAFLMTAFLCSLIFECASKSTIDER